MGEDQAPHHHLGQLEVGLDLAEHLLRRAEVGDHVRAAVALLHRERQLALAELDDREHRRAVTLHDAVDLLGNPRPLLGRDRRLHQEQGFVRFH